jgi:hypothetical protein
MQAEHFDAIIIGAGQADSALSDLFNPNFAVLESRRHNPLHLKRDVDVTTSRASLMAIREATLGRKGS